jgi:CelD/BcsL family acetyltransferase involved in cellulose biosynthesis
VAFGSVVRMLGSGQICSDYLTILCNRDFEEDVAEIIAEYLADSHRGAANDFRGWDRMELFGIDCDDRPTEYLAESLRHRACTIHRRSTINCWRIELPSTWEEYFSRLSKNCRKDANRLQHKYFDSGLAVLRSIDKSSELDRGLEILIDLHQRRWESLGQPGCYASPRFRGFIEDVSPQLMQHGQLQIKWLEVEGRPAAVEYQLLGGGVIYAYQTGIDPKAVKYPGKLSNLANIRRAIESGYVAYDFLRGDEPYKAHFRATARPSMEIRIIPDRPAAQIRHTLWLTGSNVKRWLKKGLKTVGK